MGDGNENKASSQPNGSASLILNQFGVGVGVVDWIGIGLGLWIGLGLGLGLGCGLGLGFWIGVGFIASMIHNNNNNCITNN
jgi:hypothetical protein